MNRGEIEKLLGGYAAGTLTVEERRALLEAALEDQELFNALGDEEALRELLSDPVSRGRLRAALEPRRRAGWFSRPLTWALAGSCAAAILTIGVAWRLLSPIRLAVPVQTAKVGSVPAAAAREEPAASAPAPREADTTVPPAVPGAVRGGSLARRETAGPKGKPATVRPPAEAERAGAIAPPAQGAARKKNEETGEARLEAAAPVRIGARTLAVTESSEKKDVRRAGAEQAVVQVRPAQPAAVALLSTSRAHPGFDYQVLRRAGAGAWEETSPGAAFRRGDMLRLVIVPRFDGELQVHQETGEGVWRAVTEPGSHVRAGESYTVPSADGFGFADQPLRFLVTLTRAGATPMTAEITLAPAR